MKIQKLNIKNFKGIESVEEDISGKNVYLVGGNGTGKTSFIDAIWYGLTGKGAPPQITHNNAKKGVIEIDLGDYIARTKLKNNRSSEFELENKNFNKETDKFVKAPRTHLESMIGVLDFDIKKFFEKSEAEQVKYFCKVQGIDFTDIDSEIEENEETRRFDKKRAKALEETISFYKKEDAEAELVDIVFVANTLGENEKSIATYNKIKEAVQKKKERDAEIVQKMADLELELFGDGQPEGVKGLRTEITDGEAWLQDDGNKPLSNEELEQIQERLDTANETNERINKAKEAKKQESELKLLEDNIEENTDNISNLKAKKAKRMSEAIKVEGLEYDTSQERFLFDGLPFDEKQINTSAQLVAGMKIASTMLKDLRILKVDASLIDKIEFQKVLDWAKSQDIELFIELVDREAAKLQILIED